MAKKTSNEFAVAPAESLWLQHLFLSGCFSGALCFLCIVPAFAGRIYAQENKTWKETFPMTSEITTRTGGYSLIFRFTWIGVPPAPRRQEGQPPDFRHLLCSRTHTHSRTWSKTQQRQCCDSVMRLSGAEYGKLRHNHGHIPLKKQTKTHVEQCTSFTCGEVLFTLLISHPLFPTVPSLHWKQIPPMCIQPAQVSQSRPGFGCDAACFRFIRLHTFYSIECIQISFQPPSAIFFFKCNFGCLNCQI